MIVPLAVAMLAGSRFEAATGHVQLVAEVTDVRAGQEFLVGIQLAPAPGWHTYWMNQGDSGSPTSVEWRLPKGWTAGPIRWPTPSRIVTSGIVSYGYEAPTMLLETLAPPADLKGGSVTLAGRVKWLTCTPEMCEPANGDFKLKLPVTTRVPTPNAVWSMKLAEDAGKIPGPLVGATALAQLDGGHTVMLTLRGAGAHLVKPGKPYFFPDAPGMISHSQTQIFQSGEKWLSGRLPVSEYSVKPPTRLTGVLKAPTGDAFANGARAVFIDVPIFMGSIDFLPTVGSQENKHA